MTQVTMQRLQNLLQRGEITEAEFAQYAKDGARPMTGCPRKCCAR